LIEKKIYINSFTYLQNLREFREETLRLGTFHNSRNRDVVRAAGVFNVFGAELNTLSTLLLGCTLADPDPDGVTSIKDEDIFGFERGFLQTALTNLGLLQGTTFVTETEKDLGFLDLDIIGGSRGNRARLATKELPEGLRVFKTIQDS